MVVEVLVGFPVRRFTFIAKGELSSLVILLASKKLVQIRFTLYLGLLSFSRLNETSNGEILSFLVLKRLCCEDQWWA